MTKGMLSSADCATFFENVGSMISVGVQADEAVFIIADAQAGEDDALKSVSMEVYRSLLTGTSLARAMEATGRFPQQAVAIVHAGERSGHVDSTLASLAEYYDEESRLHSKVRTSVTYPCVMLCVLTIVMAFTVGAILPVFESVYEGMAGSLATSSFSAVNVAVIIGWVALVITLIVTLVALCAFIASGTEGGRRAIMGVAQKLPGIKHVLYDIELSRFIAVLSAFTAAGQNTDDAVGSALATVQGDILKAKVTQAYGSMMEPVRANSLTQAFSSFGVLDVANMRKLTFGLRSGSLDGVLMSISETLFNDAIDDMDDILDRVEPVLSGFVTLAVGVTLIAVMLPLIGMMGAIG
ncbi:MAG: type II secretion system F family protein [Eggerthellaceae bacterium]|nr:type II secretion system F family protein [Eggerthellaceae bacterium]